MPKAKVLTSVNDVIAELGGTHAVAKLTKRRVTAVHNWVALKRFSRPTFLVMMTALDAKGFSAPPRLWNMEGKFASAA